MGHDSSDRRQSLIDRQSYSQNRSRPELTMDQSVFLKKKTRRVLGNISSHGYIRIDLLNWKYLNMAIVVVLKPLCTHLLCHNVVFIIYLYNASSYDESL